MAIEVGAMHLLLNCLAVLTHQSHSSQISSQQNEVCSISIISNKEINCLFVKLKFYFFSSFI